MISVSGDTFQDVHKKLDILGYKQPFDYNSLSLVNALVDDLIFAINGSRQLVADSANKHKFDALIPDQPKATENRKTEIIETNRSNTHIHSNHDNRIKGISFLYFVIFSRAAGKGVSS